MADHLQATDYLKPRQAAKYLNSSASTLAKRRLYGGGPQFTRMGFMANNIVRSTSDGRPS